MKIYSPNPQFNAVIHELLALGFPPIPVAPQTPSNKNKKGGYFGGFSGKNPSYLKGFGHHAYVTHKRYQDTPPSETEIKAWFVHPNTGVGTMCGYDGTIWLDFDSKNFESQEECDRQVHDFIARNNLADGWIEQTGGGGWRVPVKVLEKPGFTNFALEPSGGKLGEALGHGRFTVLAPSIHPKTGKPYRRVSTGSIPVVESLESIGIYPAAGAEVKQPIDIAKLQTQRNERKASLGIKHDLVDFFNYDVLPKLTPEQQFNWEGHNFQQFGKTLKGCPPWRQSASGTSFHVWWDGNHYAWQDKATGVGGGVVQYRWMLKGGVGTPKGKDFVDIVAELAADAGVPMPEWQPTEQEAVASADGNKVTRLEGYNERVKRTQDALRDISKYNPVIQTSKWFSLLEKGFLKPEEIQKETPTTVDLRPGVYVAKSAMGGGKSVSVRDIILNFPCGNVMSYRNSLLRQMSHHPDIRDKVNFIWDIKGIKSREQQQAAWIASKQGWLSGCIESIREFVPKPVLVLEEIEALKRDLLSGSICRRNRRLIIKLLKEHIQKAQYIFVTDANATGSTLKWLQSIVPDKQMHVIHNITRRFEWDCYFYQGAEEVTAEGIKKKPNSKVGFEEDLLAAVASGKNILVPTDSQRWAEAMELRINQYTPEVKTLRIDSHTSASDDKQVRQKVGDFLSNPDNFLVKEKPQVVFYTPTVEGSLDITLENYFDSVWGYFTHLNYVSCTQMLGRLRTNAPRYIFAKTFVGNEDMGCNSPLPHVLAKHLFEHNYKTIKDILLEQYPDVQNDLDLAKLIESLLDPESGEYKNADLQALLELRAQENYSRSNLRQLFAEELQNAGHVVHWKAPEAFIGTSATSEQRKQIIAESAEAIAKAKEITLEQAYEIQASQEATMSDKHAATKAILQHRLPQFEITEEFLTDHYLTDRGWIGRQETRFFLAHSEIAQSLDQDAWLAGLEQDEMWWDVRSNSLKIKALTVLGITEIVERGESWSKDTLWLKEFHETAMQNKGLVKLAFNITVKRDSDPCYLLGRVLRQAGYPVRSNQWRVKSGERKRSYKVDQKALCDEGYYAKVYEAIEHRMTTRYQEKQAWLAHNVSQTDHLNILITSVCDTPEVPPDLDLRDGGENQKLFDNPYKDEPFKPGDWVYTDPSREQLAYIKEINGNLVTCGYYKNGAKEVGALLWELVRYSGAA